MSCATLSREVRVKALHRPDLFCWSSFYEPSDIDLHSTVIVRPSGTVVVDPLPLGAHDLAHLRRLGPVRQIVVTNEDHVRASEQLVLATGAELCAPELERELLGSLPVHRWLRDGDLVHPGVVALALQGSKTPGEMALWVDESVLIAGDLVRGTRAGVLSLLPTARLTDRQAALRTLRRLVELGDTEAVLVADGWSVFSRGRAELEALLIRESSSPPPP